MRRVVAAAVPLVLVAALSGCGSLEPEAAPSCGQVVRLALVAQSVPTAAYLPCVRTLPPGWTAAGFEARDGRTTVSLLSDRAEGRRVQVRLQHRCTVAGASAEPPRSVGVRTYLRVNSITPRYSGTFYDVFAGGCVSYSLDFPRGGHIALVDELLSSVDLLPRRQLRVDLREQLGAELDP
jgi:hypothetical protein